MRGQRGVVRRVAVVHQKPAAGPERAGHAPEHRHVLPLPEIAEAREKTDHRVELGPVGEPPHVGPDEAQPAALAVRAARLAQHERGEIDAQRPVAAARQLGRVPAEAAGDVEHARAGPEAEDSLGEIYLRACAPGRQGGPIGGEVSRIEEPTEPLARRRHVTVRRARGTRR